MTKKPVRYLEPIIHILIWVSAYLIIISFVKTIGPFKKDDDSLLYPVTFGTLTNIALFYLSSLRLIPRYTGKKLALSLLFLIFLITTVDFLTDIAFFNVYYSSANESQLTQFATNFFINLVILSLSLGYGYSRVWFKNERQKQQLKSEKLSAELNFLKAQVNPHFLFNVLNLAFASASKSGDEATADIIERIASLIRYMLYESNVEKVDIEKEIDYIENFITLQKLRISPDIDLNVSFSYKGDTKSCQIAPLILIPFVENAFKHGIKLDKPSFINIDLNYKSGELNFTVENSNFAQSTNQNNSNSGIGLENVKRRLELLYQNRFDIEIIENNSIFKVMLCLYLNPSKP
jgi:two-component system, LytTR family, sensor kinase